MSLNDLWSQIDWKTSLFAFGGAVAWGAKYWRELAKDTADLSESRAKSVESEKDRLERINREEYDRLREDRDRYRTKLLDEERAHSATKIDRDRGWNKLRWCYEEWRQTIHDWRGDRMKADFRKERVLNALESSDPIAKIQRILEQWSEDAIIPEAPDLDSLLERPAEEFRYKDNS